MKHTYLFWLLLPGIITVLILSTSISVFSSTSENNTVLQQAERSLEANQKQLATVSPEPVPNVVPSAVQEIHGDSFVKGVFFTWVIISSDNEVSINLRYNGDGTTPPVSVAATSLTGEGKSVTMKGNTVLNAGWVSPTTVSIIMNGESSLYDSTGINVIASALESSPPTVETLSDKPTTPTNQIKQPSVSSTAKLKPDFVNSNFAILFANPDNYVGSTIDVTGKVANFPEVGLLQMYIEGDVRHDAVVHYNASFGFVEDDCVKVSGIVEEQFYGTNAFSATRIVPSISARTIEKIDCNQAINPALKTVVSEKSQIKGGIKVVFHKAEFSDKNTRVYLTVENLNPKVGITFYESDAKAIQGNRQYTTAYSFDVDYPSIKSDIPPGIREDGVVLFDPLNYKGPIAKFQFKATRSDTYTTYDFIFPIAIPK
jgi:hypothetical protein